MILFRVVVGNCRSLMILGSAYLVAVGSLVNLGDEVLSFFSLLLGLFERLRFSYASTSFQAVAIFITHSECEMEIFKQLSSLRGCR